MDRGAWQPTVSPWGHKDLDMTEHTSTSHKDILYNTGYVVNFITTINRVKALKIVNHKKKKNCIPEMYVIHQLYFNFLKIGKLINK